MPAHPYAATKVVDPLLGERRVVGHGARTHVRRHGEDRGLGGQVGAHGGIARAFDHGYGVVLPQAQAGCAAAIQRSDGRRDHPADSAARAHETGEEPGSADFGGEAEFEGDVLDGIVGVIDLDAVKNIGIEGKIVGTIGRLEKSVHVQNERDLTRVVIADECEKVGDVSGMVQCGQGRFAVARSHCGMRRCEEGRE